MAIGAPKKVKIIDGQRTDRPSGKIRINEVPQEKVSVDDGVTAKLDKPVILEENPPQPVDPDEKKKLAAHEAEADMQALNDIIDRTDPPKKVKKTRKKKGDRNE